MLRLISWNFERLLYFLHTAAEFCLCLETDLVRDDIFRNRLFRAFGHDVNMAVPALDELAHDLRSHTVACTQEKLVAVQIYGFPENHSVSEFIHCNQLHAMIPISHE